MATKKKSSQGTMARTAKAVKSKTKSAARKTGTALKKAGKAIKAGAKKVKKAVTGKPKKRTVKSR